ncbi:LLM class flavin-dependent oxidoreductase [Kitasatospora sp. NPDC059088]|uniref:LLM class flavin-dependent oxidoreductase n=1 Tax=unclassified Kitasatospora TaxID=2633591 RepID=UPI00368C6195
MPISVVLPVMPSDPAQLVPYAELVREGRAARLWQGQSLRLETHQAFAYLAGLGHRVPVGTAVALMPLRHELDAALQARSLARLTGHRTVLGLGPGAADFVAELRGAPYPRPGEAAAGYLRTVRALLAGAAHGGLPDELDHPGVELGLGVLRPALARVAGREADAAITWMTPPGYLRDVLTPALARGAAEAGRPVPRLVTVVHAALDRPGRNPYRLAYDAAHAHLASPHYTDMLRRAGLRVHPSSPSLGARALVDSGTFVHGDADAVAAGLAAYGRAGVDEVVVNVAGVAVAEGAGAALADLREILDAVRRKDC